MNIRRGAFVIAALLGLVACSTKKGNDDTASTAAPTTTAPPPAPTPTGPPPPAIEAHVKAELDNRPEGITGTAMAVPNATALLHAPAGWVPAKSGDFLVAPSPDKKAQIAASTFPADGPAPVVQAAATALGLTDCQWGPPEAVIVGKTKLASQAADGVCKRGPATVHTAWVAPTAEKLLVLGTWEDGGDSANVFGAMRSIAKPPPQMDPLAPCCQALRQNARSAPPDQRQHMLMAANVCDQMRKNPQGRQMIQQLRGQLRNARMPAQCR